MALMLKLLTLLALLDFGSPKESADVEASACVNSIHNRKETHLICDKSEGIEIVSVEVGQSSNASCISDYCPFGPIANRSNLYYQHVFKSCHHYSTCNLSSTTLKNMSNQTIFPHCGVAHKVRNTVKVVYRCVDVGGTPSTSPPATPPITTEATTSGKDGIWPTTTRWKNHSTDPAKQQGEKDDNLIVKIVAPILGVLTLVSMIVLVVCLKSNLSKRPRQEAVKPDQSTNYEDIGEPHQLTQEEAYYSEPRDSNYGLPVKRPSRDIAQGASWDQSKPKPAFNIHNNESLTDDGFYDTVSDDNTYSLAEPVTSLRHVELRINKQKTKGTQLLPTASHSQQNRDNHTSVDVVDSGHLPLVKRGDNSTFTGVVNELYSIANPVDKEECAEEVIEEPVMIRNTIYEQTTPMHIGQTETSPSDVEVGELIDNDIYGS